MEAALDEACPESIAKSMQHMENSNSKLDGDDTADSAIANATNTSSSKEIDSNPISFPAWNQSKALDIYTYHRGREGLEKRDTVKGDLLCDVAATDTNFHREELQSLAVLVTIQLPLCNIMNGESHEGSEQAQYFRETILWDLEDTETPTPPIFAARLGEQFGLSLVETLELSESIQNQLYNSVSDRATYSTAVPIKDAFGLTRDAPVSSLHSLYGEVMDSVQGGYIVPKKQGRPRVLRQASLSKVTTVKPSRPPSNNVTVGRSQSTKSKPIKIVYDSSAVVEPEYVDEIKRRLLDESKRQVHEQGTNGKLEFVVDALCHVCRSRKKTVAVFPCGASTHAICETHLLRLHGLSFSSPELSLDFCPVCSLWCSCKLCCKRIHRKASELKEHCLQQGTSPTNTQFGGHVIVPVSRPEITEPVRSHATGSRVSMQRKVEKIPITTLPKDAAEGKVLDPTLKLEYMTVYTANGSYRLQESEISELTVLANHEAPSEEPAAHTPKPIESCIEGGSSAYDFSSNSSVVEDGSVDHCIVCKQCGNLLCCDYCPRAYHGDCIQGENIDLSGDKWECPACRRESAGVAKEQMDGARVFTAMIECYSENVETCSPNALKEVKILSIIYEMVQYLMSYDFGYMFSAPVDLEQVPIYSSIVKEPMDLGTIAERLMNGGYSRFVQENGLERVIVAALNDIELVWHNCFLFNAPGSAIYRMAEVQRAAVDRIKASSLLTLLSAHVISAVSGYRTSCELYRQNLLGSKTGEQSTRRKVQPTATAKDQPKVNAKNKRVAVLDPESGRIVKIYSTLTAAVAAVELLIGRNHPCEWNFPKVKQHDLMIRRIVKESSREAAYRLYGYRWLLLNDLKAGTVQFSCISAVTNGIQAGSDDLRDKAPPDTASLLDDTQSNARSLEQSQKESRTDHADESLTSYAEYAIVKQHAESGSTLNGFDSVDTAYQDWLSTLESSRSLNADEELKTPATFRAHYLNGSRCIDGVTWRTTTGKTMEFPDSLDRQDPNIFERVKLSVDETNDGAVITDGASRGDLLGKASSSNALPLRGGNPLFASPLIPKKKNGTSVSTFQHGKA
jgi:hypothetical protein